MNIEKLKNYWYPIARAEEIKNKPVSKKLLGFDIVIVKLQNKLYAYEDRCPHRNVPLSNGFIKNNKLNCGYHGWQFGLDGSVEHIVGCKDCKVNKKIETYSVKAIDNIVWINLTTAKEFTNYFKPKHGFDSRLRFKKVYADFIHTIENFLDPIHTSFIHKGILRANGIQRMKIRQKSDNKSFTTFYDLIDKQNGLINRLFDNGIDKNIASFITPGFAKIEYLKKEKLVFEVAIFFVPIQKGEVDMVVNVSIKKGLIPSSIKFMMLKPFLELVFYQDKKILQSQYKSQQKLHKPYIIAKTDLVIEHLLYLLADAKKVNNKEMIMELS